MTRVTARARDRRRSHVQVKVARTPIPQQEVSPPPPSVELIDDIAPVLAHVPEIYRPEVCNLGPLPSEVPAARDPNPKSSTGLALDLVLNELVLQARLTTTATGALIALKLNNDMVCRAMTGATATEVAACLNMRSGIVSNCLTSGSPGRADDMASDTQPDVAAYRRSGVRSTMVVPIANEKGTTLGILQIFSPRPNAFCDRDVLTLQALGRRIATNVEMAQKNESPIPAEILVAAVPPIEQSPGPVRSRRRRTASTFRVPGLRATKLDLFSRFFNAQSLMSSRVVRVLILLMVLAGSARVVWTRASEKQYSEVNEQSAAQVPAPLPAIPVDKLTTVIDAYVQPDTQPAVQPKSRKIIAHGLAASVAIERKPVSKPSKPTLSEKNIPSEAASTSDTAVSKISKPSLASPVPPAVVVRDQSAPAPVANASLASSDFELLPTQSAMGLLVQRVEPEYPNSARQQHIQGKVLLDVKVNEQGSVDGVTLISGESQLMNAAAAAVQQWHFQPLIKDNKPRKFESRIAIDFKLVAGGSLPGQ